MKKLLLSVLMVILAAALWAVPAVPYPVEIIQPDGSAIMVRLHGDEYHHFYTLIDGTPLRLDDKGFLVKDNRTVDEVLHIGASIRKAARISEAQRIPSNYPLKGSPKSLVLLVGFQDEPFQQNLQDFNDLLNQSGYSHNGAIGSCRDYFIAASDSLFQPQFDVYGPYTLKDKLEAYGAPDGAYKDKKPGMMVVEACQLAAADGVDFEQYDTDNDGVLDNVFIFYAGYNESEGAAAKNIWPHKSDVTPYNVTVDGKRLAAYACTAEHSGTGGNIRAGIGTFCHEFGHVLGLPDLYDTNYNYYSVADWSIMCSGSHTDRGRTPPTYSAYERFYLGWLKPEQLSEGGQYSLLPLSTDNQAYLIAESSHNLSGKNPSPSEFFILEYRVKSGWDAYLPGQGMVVWHIDYSLPAWDTNTPNNGPNIMRVHLEEANGIYWNQRRNGEGGRPSDSYPGTQNVTTFQPKLHNGTVLTDQNIFNITDHAGSLSFIYRGLGEVAMQTDVTDLYLVTTVSDNKAIVDWTPQSFALSAQKLHSDTIVITAKTNFYVAAGEVAPERGSSEWKRTLELIATDKESFVQKVWISYIPSRQSCDEVNSSLTIATSGATISVALKATSPRPIYITVPELKPATNITPYSFRMAWKPVKDAVMYYVTLYQSTEGESTTLQGFEFFGDADAMANQGWTSNFNRITTSAKSEGNKSLYFKSTGEQVTSELFLAPITSISFWLNAFSADVDVIGSIDLEAWNGSEWVAPENAHIDVFASTKRKTVTYNFNLADNFTQFRLTFTENGGNGVALDAFIANCSRNVNYIYRGKDFFVDAFEDEALCAYEITNLAANTTYYYSMQSSDITKGCEEHISPLSEAMSVTTLALSDDKEKDNSLPLTIDTIKYDAPTHVVYLSNPQSGGILNIYDAKGKLVYSCQVFDGVSEYIIPIERLQRGQLYLIKHLENHKLKRKFGWAKFIL